MRNSKGQFIKGSSGFTGKHSEETRNKIKVARKKQGSNVWNRGTNNSGMKGKKRTDEWKSKMRERFLGKPRHDLRGENHPLWKGGLTPVMLQIRHCFEYRQWRSDVFTRDDFVCQICFIRGGRLNADHFPKRFRDLIYENNIKSLEDSLNCSELWDINNGRTLCEQCHRKIPAKIKGDGK